MQSGAVQQPLETQTEEPPPSPLLQGGESYSGVVDWRHLLDVGEEAGWPADQVAVLSEN